VVVERLDWDASGNGIFRFTDPLAVLVTTGATTTADVHFP
jgi:hypothetical protein